MLPNALKNFSQLQLMMGQFVLKFHFCGLHNGTVGFFLNWKKIKQIIDSFGPYVVQGLQGRAYSIV